MNSIRVAQHYAKIRNQGGFSPFWDIELTLQKLMSIGTCAVSSHQSEQKINHFFLFFASEKEDRSCVPTTVAQVLLFSHLLQQLNVWISI
jgi:hypothetical protein